MLEATTAAHSISVHYHHAPLIWFLFLLGQILHALLQLDTTATNHGASRRAMLYKNWIRLCYRVAVSSVAFGIIWQHPQLIHGLLGMIGIQIGGDEAAVFALPMNNLLALGYGLCIDSLISYIPWFKNLLPTVEEHHEHHEHHEEVHHEHHEEAAPVVVPEPPAPEAEVAPVEEKPKKKRKVSHKKVHKKKEE
jgi:hypothetical protein